MIFTIVSPILMHDSRTVSEILNNYVFNHGLFKYFGIKEVNIWMDNAPNHFRNFENLATLESLSKKFCFEITANFFAEYHGKSECDRHFGFISRIYTDRTSYGGEDISTTTEFLNLYKDAVRKSGGSIIPKNGACYDELLPESGSALNVVASKFTYSVVEDLLNSTRDQTVPNKISLLLPYLKEVLVVQPIKRRFQCDEKFKLNFFYCFKFSGGTIHAKLTSSSKKRCFHYKKKKIIWMNIQ